MAVETQTPLSSEVEAEPTTAPVEQPAEHGDEEANTPRGAFLFVLLMLAGYAIYWIFVYAEVVFRRGG